MGRVENLLGQDPPYREGERSSSPLYLQELLTRGGGVDVVIVLVKELVLDDIIELIFLNTNRDLARAFLMSFALLVLPLEK